jgi:hypothetical protein
MKMIANANAHRSRAQRAPRQGAVELGLVPHAGERGFALLLVFLMAAVIGITLWAELPRVAIQSQRAKEQMLMERGEQFKRAIQLFLRANKNTRFPADMDDLDRGYNNLRFLRHRYKDPMTGKDEWRIIHMQGGVLTDSLLTKPKDSDKPEASTLGQNISAQPGLGELANGGQPQANAMNRRRPSEGGTGGGVGPDGLPIQPIDQGNGTQPGTGPGGAPQPPGVPGMPGGPGSPFGAGAPGPGAIPGMPGMPGQFPGQPGFPGQFGAPGNIPGGANAGNSGDSGSTVGGYGSTLGGSMAGSAPGSAPGLTGGLASAGAANAANGMPGAVGQNSAAGNLLNNLLTQPRPGGPTGLGLGQGTVIGGGMAGVASKMDAEGLMVYNDRTNYKEWEFVYDPTKDRPRQDPRAMLVGNQMGTPSTPTPGTATPSNQPGTFNQPGQGGAGAPTVTNGPGSPNAPGGQNGTNPNGQPGAPTGAGTSSQAGTGDLRPGKK